MSQPKVTVVAAVSLDGAVGYRGKLPWRRIPGEQAAFKRLTSGGVLLMGRKTYESLPRGFDPGDRQLHVVSSLGPNDAISNAFVHVTISCALRMLRGGDREIFVIGGTALWEVVLGHADRMVITHVLAPFSRTADTWFPVLDWSKWVQIAGAKVVTWGLHTDVIAHRIEYRRKHR